MTMSVFVQRVTLVVAVRMLWITAFQDLVKMVPHAPTSSLTIIVPVWKILMYVSTVKLTVENKQ